MIKVNTNHSQRSVVWCLIHVLMIWGVGEQWDSADDIKLSRKTKELQRILIKLHQWTAQW